MSRDRNFDRLLFSRCYSSLGQIQFIKRELKNLVTHKVVATDCFNDGSKPIKPTMLTVCQWAEAHLLPAIWGAFVVLNENIYIKIPNI